MSGLILRAYAADDILGDPLGELTEAFGKVVTLEDNGDCNGRFTINRHSEQVAWCSPGNYIRAWRGSATTDAAASVTRVTAGSDVGTNARYSIVVGDEPWSLRYHDIGGFLDDYTLEDMPQAITAEELYWALYAGEYPGSDPMDTDYFSVTGSGTSLDPFIVEFIGTYGGVPAVLEEVGGPVTTIVELEAGAYGPDAVYSIVLLGGPWNLRVHDVADYSSDYTLTGMPDDITAEELRWALYGEEYPSPDPSDDDYFSVTGDGSEGDPFIVTFTGSWGSRSAALDAVGDPRPCDAGFFIEEGDDTLLSEDEEGGEDVTRQGKGPIALYSDAIVWPRARARGRPRRPRGGEWVFKDRHPGAILRRLLREAYMRGHDLFSWSFTNAEDSAEDAWPADEEAKRYRVPVGTNLLSLVGELRETGLYVRVDPDTLEMSALPEYENDLSGSIEYEAGVDIATIGARMVRASRSRSVVLLEGENRKGHARYVVARDATLRTKLGRRKEGYVSFQRTPTRKVLRRIGKRRLRRWDRQYDGPFTMEVIETEGKVALVDFREGDTIGVHIPDVYEHMARRVASITLSEPEAVDDDGAIVDDEGIDVTLGFDDLLAPPGIQMSRKPGRGDEEGDDRGRHPGEGVREETGSVEVGFVTFIDWTPDLAATTDNAAPTASKLGSLPDQPEGSFFDGGNEIIVALASTATIEVDDGHLDISTTGSLKQEVIAVGSGDAALGLFDEDGEDLPPPSIWRFDFEVDRISDSASVNGLRRISLLLTRLTLDEGESTPLQLECIVWLGAFATAGSVSHPPGIHVVASAQEGTEEQEAAVTIDPDTRYTVLFDASTEGFLRAKLWETGTREPAAWDAQCAWPDTDSPYPEEVWQLFVVVGDGTAQRVRLYPIQVARGAEPGQRIERALIAEGDGSTTVFTVPWEWVKGTLTIDISGGGDGDTKSESPGTNEVELWVAPATGTRVYASLEVA